MEQEYRYYIDLRTREYLKVHKNFLLNKNLCQEITKEEYYEHLSTLSKTKYED